MLGQLFDHNTRCLGVFPSSSRGPLLILGLLEELGVASPTSLGVLHSVLVCRLCRDRSIFLSGTIGLLGGLAIAILLILPCAAPAAVIALACC